MNERKIAVITGTFDPITLGHVDLVKRAAALFDEVIVAVLVNENKHPQLSQSARVDLITRACNGIEGFSVQCSSETAVDFCRRVGARAIVRGIRNGADLTYELGMADYNKEHGGIETVFFPVAHGLERVSSSVIREHKMDKAHLRKYLPEEIIDVYLSLTE